MGAYGCSLLIEFLDMKILPPKAVSDSGFLGRSKHALILAVLIVAPLIAQVEVYPRDAHVNLYFPQLADGGTSAQRWQTSFTFVNSASQNVNVKLYLYANDGSPMALDMGGGPTSIVAFSMPANGRTTLRSRMATQTTVTGWAVATASLPIQGTVLFRQFIGSQPAVELSAAATLPSSAYQSPANRNLGIALANVYSAPISVSLGAFDQNGALLGTVQLSLAAREHRSFNLWQALPGLPADFLGSVQLWSHQDTPSYQFLAWTLNEDGGVLSTLPSGRLEWPVAHWDRIWLVFQKALDAAKRRYPSLDWNSPSVRLEINAKWYGLDGKEAINATSHSDGTLKIPYSISELISDSQSELGWLVAHELGHQVQFRGRKLVFDSSNQETDADIIGLQLCLDAGFDPYAAAGTLAKLAMVTGTAGLSAQVMQDYDVALGLYPHLSWGTRINNLWNLIVQVCQIPSNKAACARFKAFQHPDLPGGVPLALPHDANLPERR